MEPMTIIAGTLAAVSAAAGVAAAAWPLLASRSPDRAMKLAGHARRQADPGEAQARRRQQGLRKRPRALFQAVFDHFDLAAQADSAGVTRKLRAAGYRGHAALVTYLAARILSPVFVFAAVAVYIPLVLRPDIPFPAALAMAAAFGVTGWYAPDLYLSNRAGKRRREISRAWPDALDLVLIAVESGMGVEAAFRKVAAEMRAQSPALSEEMGITVAELSYLQDRRQAYQNLADRTGLEGVRSVVASLIQSEKHGTPVGQALRVLAQECRDMRMAEAERKAAALPPKLTVPMIVFFLPALFAVILTPAAIRMSGSW